MPSYQELHAEAERIAKQYAAVCVGTAIVTGPIPGTSVALTGIEATMVYHIARVYMFHPTLQEAGITVASLVAASGGLKHLAIEISNLIPVVGWLVFKPSIAAITCRAVGKVAIEHYEERYKERG